MRYYDALEASQTSDLSPFLSLVAECVEESLEEYEAAAKEQREREEWARSLADRFGAQERVRVASEYEVWRSAMDLLRGYMRQTVELIDSSSRYADVHFRDFGMLEFEKYLSLRMGESAKKTWFIRVDFRRGDRAARYLFFFGFASFQLKRCCHVTLHIAREEPSGSYYYELLGRLTAPNVPSLREIGYDPGAERFIALTGEGEVTEGKIEEIGRRFFEEVIRLHFAS